MAVWATTGSSTKGAFFTVHRLFPLVKEGGAFVFTTAVADGTGTPRHERLLQPLVMMNNVSRYRKDPAGVEATNGTAMVAVKSFAELEEKFFEYIKDIRYCTMTTVDKKGRPRARVLLPIWQVLDGRLLGWLAAYKTPVKTVHLARNPHATFSYWSPRQNVVHIDTVAEWVDNLEVKQEVWDLYRKGSPPSVGYDPKQYWDGGPEDPKFDVLRLDPGACRSSGARIWPAGLGKPKALPDTRATLEFSLKRR